MWPVPLRASGANACESLVLCVFNNSDQQKEQTRWKQTHRTRQRDTRTQRASERARDKNEEMQSMLYLSRAVTTVTCARLFACRCFSFFFSLRFSFSSFYVFESFLLKDKNHWNGAGCLCIWTHFIHLAHILNFDVGCRLSLVGRRTRRNREEEKKRAFLVLFCFYLLALSHQESARISLSIEKCVFSPSPVRDCIDSLITHNSSVVTVSEWEEDKTSFVVTEKTKVKLSAIQNKIREQ